MKKLALFALVLGSPAFAGSWQGEQLSKTQSEATEIVSTATLLKSHSMQCNDPAVSTSRGHLDAQASRLATAVELAYSRRSGAGERYIGLKTLEAIRPLIAEARFTLADALLEAGCLEDADKIYRDTVSTFTGASYEALRQRARIGIDDVRAKRQQP